MNMQRTASQGPVPVNINVMDVLRGVARRKLLIVAMTLMAFGLGLGLVKVFSPIYSTEAQILVQNLETPFDRVQAQDGQRNDGVDDRVIASQMSVLQSQDLGRRVIAALGLENDPEFNPLLRGLGKVSTIKLALGFGEDPRLKTPEQRALSRYNDQLSVYQLPSSNVIAIKYTSRNPETAAKVANTLAETYIAWTRESQSQPTERARDWLAQQIEALRKKLSASEDAVEHFRSEAGLLQGTTSTLGTQELSELNTQITMATAASSDARARADSIRALLKKKGSVESSPDVLASAVMQRLKEQRTDAARRAAELAAVYLPSHPRMIAAQSELTNIDRQMRTEATKVVASLEDQAQVAEAREKSLRASLDRLKAEKAKADLNDVKLKALERDAAADRALLETMLSRYAEASTRQDQSAQPGLARIIQSAAAPTSPSFPKRGPMVVLITVAGFVLALGLAFLIELMAAAARLTDAARWTAPVSDEPLPPAPAAVVARPMPQPPASAWQPPPLVPPVPALVPSLGSLASLPTGSNQLQAAVIVQQPQVTGAGQQIAAWFLSDQAAGAHRLGVMAIGGAPGDTSIAAVAAARALSASGRRVIIADLSRSGSWLLGICGVHPGAGLADLVSGTADFTKVISRDCRSQVHVLRYGVDHSERAAGLIAERAGSVIAALCQTYDVVIADLGKAEPELPGLVTLCEAALVLAPKSRTEDAADAVRTLLAAGLRAARQALLEPAAEPAAGRMAAS